MGRDLELHVAFNYSAAGDLRAALGCDVAIARFSDNLGYGPINSVEPATRRSWIEVNIGYDNPDISEDKNTFWPHVLNPDVSRVAWFSRRNSHEYCGFLEYLRRLDGLPTWIVDTTSVKSENGNFFRDTGSIPANQIQALGLANTARPLNAEQDAAYRNQWERLRADNAEMRVSDKNLNLMSVSLSFFDDALLSLVGADWQPMQRVAGDFLAKTTLDDLVIFARLYALIDVGMFETRETKRLHPDIRSAQA